MSSETSYLDKTCQYSIVDNLNHSVSLQQHSQQQSQSHSQQQHSVLKDYRCSDDHVRTLLLKEEMEKVGNNDFGMDNTPYCMDNRNSGDSIYSILKQHRKDSKDSKDESSNNRYSKNMESIFHDYREPDSWVSDYNQIPNNVKDSSGTNKNRSKSDIKGKRGSFSQKHNFPLNNISLKGSNSGSVQNSPKSYEGKRRFSNHLSKAPTKNKTSLIFSSAGMLSGQYTHPVNSSTGKVSIDGSPNLSQLRSRNSKSYHKKNSLWDNSSLSVGFSNPINNSSSANYNSSPNINHLVNSSSGFESFSKLNNEHPDINHIQDNNNNNNENNSSGFSNYEGSEMNCIVNKNIKETINEKYNIEEELYNIVEEDEEEIGNLSCKYDPLFRSIISARITSKRDIMSDKNSENNCGRSKISPFNSNYGNSAINSNISEFLKFGSEKKIQPPLKKSISNMTEFNKFGSEKKISDELKKALSNRNIPTKNKDNSILDKIHSFNNDTTTSPYKSQILINKLESSKIITNIANIELDVIQEEKSSIDRDYFEESKLSLKESKLSVIESKISLKGDKRQEVNEKKLVESDSHYDPDKNHLKVGFFNSPQFKGKHFLNKKI